MNSTLHPEKGETIVAKLLADDVIEKVPDAQVTPWITSPSY